MGADRVVRCVVWSCRETCATAKDAIAAGWGWFQPEWESKIVWSCWRHLNGKEETECEPDGESAEG